ncbi:2-succinyl-5-enolpyruvyl-6-hydroxy-3-cyclohexene-1-carboxylic-acid synthase [Synechococcus elongatus]|uniref:2-succinyl-5-enolpyruvyl-6-hydroxy-3-cyclohexene-1-carboxylate synthase n=2 Tax=Synechococcus elongatus TaxID=32046 RepID=MEND_SYNE7|nr:2-succinyl-5-enolpyruvyl-6-hydroxy-3-cyclohexene-1-carboxylic-acid synthase [Synechococcus elongatus]Q31NA4.1 RecName: Full=2-succinyl-5-enolpyruvyl-6-hydroxy-3-cyclohexene-1-carboxylate synthase; Short=SEPHCHC synthase [Synechococcus elongatus PCC 7942 = FACHB-805]Q5N5V7.1 RecName: Full=2-succinyl-5-enolpyruvyl-6-hydroxy-3-cyclohexene-1-carboxylate synthase; Short=SEPHCHC synthase [Synechococcus elongatus PCC 6301]ABB57465.1 2-succinyl-6-hydroxy-2,4-cyclohexadiene-1-carboxylate synthase [Syn
MGQAAAITMPIDPRNLNTLWSSVLAESFVRLGLQTVVICPGSRSAPLAIAFAEHPEIDAIPILDERSAGFFALGRAKASHRPVALICSSGTAGANFYPAVIEAKESGVPLLVITADRPPELRQCHAGQAIDQLRLFGSYALWEAELALPVLDLGLLRYLRQTAQQAWQQALRGGPVHLNQPLREPLAPIADPATQTWLAQQWPGENFFAELLTAVPTPQIQQPLPPLPSQGLITVGPIAPEDPAAFVQAIAQLSAHLGWPVLSDAVTPLRQFADHCPRLISSYDLILRQPHWRASLQPEAVLQIGELPTSKELRLWLTEQTCPRWIVSPRPENFDPLHGSSHHLPVTVEAIAIPATIAPASDYSRQWQQAETAVQAAIAQHLAQVPDLTEPGIARLLSQHLPAQTPIFVANSTPIRDLEWFWLANDQRRSLYCSRGANGIDGTLSTAIGIAHQNRPSVLITGDLSLLHDSNGFLQRSQLQGHLTVVLIDNSGGGIFELLPIRDCGPSFEPFVATPQTVDFAALCQAYGVDYQAIATEAELIKAIQTLPTSGIRVLHLFTDRRQNAAWRRALFAELAAIPSQS